MLPDNLRLYGQKLVEKGLWFLAPFSLLYAVVIFFRNQLYDWGLLRTIKAPCTVVSVGNIVAGGTGKTPFVHLLGSAFAKRKVAILSRGYGTVPDEAMLLAKRLPHAKVLIAKNRAKLALQVGKHFDLILLDDGFQHRKLFRDFDIVLTRKKREHYLPWGFLRDSPKRLKRADAVFSENELELRVKRILSLKGEEIKSVEGKKAAIFCGIAAPERFKKTVEELGVEIVSETYFADHGEIDLEKLPQAELYICTEKDAVKLGETSLPIVYLEMQMQMAQGVEKWEKLIEKIDQKIDNRRQYE